ncbi:MAG: cobU [Dehalococcoidia bacterium]|nr:cobU [Dehalococcoidia bacterium]
MSKTLTLILGGARSGKSAFAQRLAQAAPSVLFVATAEAGDADMAARILAHQQARPASWKTLEEPLELEKAIPLSGGGATLIVLDCLTLWVSNILLKDQALTVNEVEARARGLLIRYREGEPSWVVVSNEVGLGIVPETYLGRRYRDLLGRVNQCFAEAADQVYLMVAGLALDLTRASPGPATER